MRRGSEGAVTAPYGAANGALTASPYIDVSRS
jgi:hypothetical protein